MSESCWTVVSCEIASAGSGYAVDDYLFIWEGRPGQWAQVIVTSVGESGEVLAFDFDDGGCYDDQGTNPHNTNTSGNGSGCTINVTEWAPCGSSSSTSTSSSSTSSSSSQSSSSTSSSSTSSSSSSTSSSSSSTSSSSSHSSSSNSSSSSSHSSSSSSSSSSTSSSHSSSSSSTSSSSTSSSSSSHSSSSSSRSSSSSSTTSSSSSSSSSASEPLLKLWFDASDASTLFKDAALTQPVTADGDPVGGWKDKSGGDHHATTSDSAARPVYKTGVQNNLPVVRFDGINDVLAGTVPGCGGNSSKTLFAVLRLAGNWQSPFALGANETSKAFALNTELDDVLRVRGTQVNNDLESGPRQWCVKLITLVKDTDTLSLYENGVQVAAAALSAANVESEAFLLGAFPSLSNLFLNGDICEMRLYAEVFDSGAREVIEGDLMAKWGLLQPSSSSEPSISVSTSSWSGSSSSATSSSSMSSSSSTCSSTSSTSTSSTSTSSTSTSTSSTSTSTSSTSTSTSSASASSSSASPQPQVSFDKDPVVVGISSVKDVRGTVVATITPKEKADDVSFSSTEEYTATVVEEKREEKDDSVLVTLKITGVHASTAKQDTQIEAVYDDEPIASCDVTVVVPKTQKHAYAEAVTPINSSAAVPGDGTIVATAIKRTVTISISDQFDDKLDKIYDGIGYVSESWTGPHYENTSYRFSDGPIDKPPPGKLESGEILDEVVLGVWQPIPNSLTAGQAAAWENFSLALVFPSGLKVRNVSSWPGFKPPLARAIQHLTVHGHSVTPNFEREVKIMPGDPKPNGTMTDTVK